MRNLSVTCPFPLQINNELHTNKRRKHSHSVRFSEKNQEHIFESDIASTVPSENAHQVSEFHPNKFKKLTYKAHRDKDSSMKAEAGSSDKGLAKPEDLKVAADLVVKYLTPAFKEGRIASKVSTTYVMVCV